MTRQEQIKLQAKLLCNTVSPEEYFIMGAEWADKHPMTYDGKALLYVNSRSHENCYNEAVEKACKWLGDNFRVSSFDDTKIVTHFSNMYDLEDDFRKAMKGEQI